MSKRPAVFSSPPTTDSRRESVRETIVDEPTDVMSVGEVEIASWDEGVIAKFDTNKPQEPHQQVIAVSGDIQQGEALSDVLRDGRLVIRSIEASLVPDGSVLDLSLIEGFCAASDLVENRILVEDMLAESVRNQVFVISGAVEEGELLSDVMGDGRLVTREVIALYTPDGAVLDLSLIEGFVAVSDLAVDQLIVDGMLVPAEK